MDKKRQNELASRLFRLSGMKRQAQSLRLPSVVAILVEEIIEVRETMAKESSS